MKQLYRYLPLVLCVVLIMITGACSKVSSNVIDTKRTINIATVQPTHHPITQGLMEFQDYIDENLEDEFEIKIYTDGVIGSNSEALELIQLNSLDIAATSGSDLEAYADEYKIFSLPYVFENEEIFRETMSDSEFTDLIYNSTEDKGIVGVSWFANGVNNFYSKKKIETPEDLKGMKMRVQPSEANVNMVRGFGAAATILSYGEIYTAMQSNVIDGASNPEMALVDMKHGEVANYYSRTEHQIFTDMLVTSPKFLDSLSTEEKEIFQEGFELATETSNSLWDERIEEAIVEAEDMGLEFVEVDKEPFKEIQEPVRNNMLEQYSELDELYRIIQEKNDGEELSK